MKYTIQVIHDRFSFKYLYWGLFLAAALLMTSCAAQAPRQEVQLVEAAEPQVSTEIYFYPKAGQSVAQQDRDRYECYLWAVQQSGFDPSTTQLAPHQRVIVEPVPAEGHDTVAGTLTGALVGAALGAPHHSGRGAVIGAMAGALIGATSDASRQEQAAAVQQRYDRDAASRSAAIDRRVDDYRRAMKACLEGRNYTVR